MAANIDAPSGDHPLAAAAIVLFRPKYPENIGAAARVALNMGVARLVVVSERPPARAAMAKLATHNAATLLDQIRYEVDLAAALAPFSFVVGSTARQGRQRREVLAPRQMVAQVLPILADNPVAFLFGPEDRGLTNAELALCHLVTTIPTADFSSLNLAQAVAIVCYELYQGLGENLSPAAGAGKGARLASVRELAALQEELQQLLEEIDFSKNGERAAYWRRALGQIWGRLQLRAREVKILRDLGRAVRQGKKSLF